MRPTRSNAFSLDRPLFDITLVVGDEVVIEATKKLITWVTYAMSEKVSCYELGPNNKVPLIKKLRGFGPVDEEGHSKIPLIHAKLTVERVFASIIKPFDPRYC